ncbi:MAG: hypothetical protein LH615_15600, partial [Ferruginibacter sp.]|nr:hypothetical protein [Ferruginibacter sp.]
MKNKFVIRWLCGCLIFFVASCQQSKQEQASTQHVKDMLAQKISTEKLKNKLYSVKDLIEAGDIITRTGNDFTSQSLKT